MIMPEHDRLSQGIELDKNEKGRLKINFGYAAGVGKTYAMLDDARELQKHGVDVVVGYIEAHTRPETLQLLKELPVLPRKAEKYQNVELTEFDIDGALKRKPELIIKELRIGDLTIDYVKRLIKVKEKEVHLTPIEYKIMMVLAKNLGKVLTYQYIINEIWGPYMEENQTLRVNMANIRRKIEDNPAEPKYIITEVGVGYRMMDEIVD